MASFASAFSSFAPQSSQAWNLQAMLKTSGIPLDVQRHLVRVYASLAACVLSAALGCAGALLLAPTPLYTVEHAGYIALLSLVGTIGGMIWFYMVPVENYNKRFAILMGVAASVGLSLASLVDLTLEIDPSILITAFLMTTTVFLCFSGSAMLAQRRSYLYLGGMLSSMLTLLSLGNLINLFWRSQVIYTTNLYVGLAVFCGYVMFDTQMIIEKALIGDKDSLKHALELFLDFVSIFVRIVALLIENSEKKKSDSDNKRRG